MSDLPLPETTSVKLLPDLRDSTGRQLPSRRPTVHNYSHTEERCARVLDADGEPRVVDGRAVIDTAYVHIYRCVETGAPRAYGCEGPNTPGLVLDEDLEQPDAINLRNTSEEI